MALMCEECKCSTYLNEETGMYSCESGCACCNDPEWESDWDIHTRITNQIVEYIKLHIVSLEQDSKQINSEMGEIEDLDSDEYKTLEIEDISNNGQLIASRHLLSVVNDILSPKEEQNA